MNSVSFSNTKASQPAQTVTHLNSSSETKWRPPRKDALRFPKVGSRDSDRLNPYSSVQQAEFLVGERLRDGRNHKRPVKTPTKRQRVSLRDETPVDNGHEPRSRTKTRDLEAREEGRFSERRKTLHDFLNKPVVPSQHRHRGDREQSANTSHRVRGRVRATDHERSVVLHSNGPETQCLEIAGGISERHEFSSESRLLDARPGATRMDVLEGDSAEQSSQ